MNCPNTTLLLTPFRCGGVPHVQGMVLNIGKDALLEWLASGNAEDEVAIVRDFYEKGFPAQFDRGGYPSQPVYNRPASRIMDALNGGGIFFVARSMVDLRPEDIRDDPLFCDMRKVNHVVMTDWVTKPVSMSLIGSENAPFALRVRNSASRASGAYGNMVPMRREEKQVHEQQNEGEACEFTL